MTNSDLTLIAILLDRSGSMQSIKTDTEGGFAAYIEQQRQVPKTTEVTLAQFDTEYEVVYANRPIAEVPPLELQPRGMTALYDAVGKLVTEVGAELAKRPEHERPGTVIVVVLTDGHENSSREWSNDAVRKLIKQQEDTYNWTFLFLGANMDAVAIGVDMGIAPGQAITYAASSRGVGAVFRAAAEYSAQAQAAPAGAPRPVFTEAQRREANPDS
ncbi:VWA domain-containing protein [Nocardia sp. NPDC052566]|uniref:vWA domain-containing protein n=1 Tax=Nocardia sp. NPDC052566 TaxID=3364330 RepID=UPI0037C8459F